MNYHQQQIERLHIPINCPATGQQHAKSHSHGLGTQRSGMNPVNPINLSGSSLNQDEVSKFFIKRCTNMSGLSGQCSQLLSRAPGSCNEFGVCMYMQPEVNVQAFARGSCSPGTSYKKPSYQILHFLLSEYVCCLLHLNAIKINVHYIVEIMKYAYTSAYGKYIIYIYK